MASKTKPPRLAIAAASDVVQAEGLNGIENIHRDEARQGLTEPQIVGRFSKNRSGDEVVISLHPYGRDLFVDIRVYVVAGGRSLPTKKGLRIGVALIAELIDGLREASAEAFRLGGLDEPEADA